LTQPGDFIGAKLTGTKRKILLACLSEDEVQIESNTNETDRKRERERERAILNSAGTLGADGIYSLLLSLSYTCSAIQRFNKHLSRGQAPFYCEGT